MGRSEPVCILSRVPFEQSGQQDHEPIDWSNMPWFCDLVMLSSQIPVPRHAEYTVNQTIHWGCTQGPHNVNIHA